MWLAASENTFLSGQNIMSVMVPAIIALASAIGILWKHILKQHIRTVTKLDATEEHIKEANAKLVSLSSKVGLLEGRQEGVEKLAYSVIKEIRDLDRNTRCKFDPGNKQEEPVNTQEKHA